MNRQPPSVVVEQVGIDGAAADAVDGLTLPPGSERLEFQYTGLSLLAPEKVRFRYRLEGFDSDWVDAGTRRTAYYTNLFPGRYTFRVIACNNDGIWSEQGASLGLRLRPHFYQTRSFYALGAGLVALAGWGVHRLRIRQVHARFAAVLAERTRMARELHDTLEQGLMAVRLQLEATGMRVTEGRRVIERHLRLARDIVDGVLAEARRSVPGPGRRRPAHRAFERRAPAHGRDARGGARAAPRHPSPLARHRGAEPAPDRAGGHHQRLEACSRPPDPTGAGIRPGPGAAVRP